MLWRRLEIEWTVNNFQKNQTCCFHTKKNKIIGTQEISFKFPNSAKPLYVECLQTQNKNLAIAKRSRVSCAHNTLRASIGLNITP